MGHWCRVCGDTKPNEKFSGKGHRNHICKECSRKSKKKIVRKDDPSEIINFLTQSNISNKNILRLEQLACSENKEISELANMVLEVAKIKPHKKNRIEFLADENTVLLQKLASSGLIDNQHSKIEK